MTTNDAQMPQRVLAPSPEDHGPCACDHAAHEHWIGEPGGCEHKDCDCTTYRPKETP